MDNAKPILGPSESRLKVEAQNIYRETGLTPRQLAEQRAELLAALTNIVFGLGAVIDADAHFFGKEKPLWLEQARAAIAKATGGAA